MHFILPFESTPQASQRLLKEPEGTPGDFYRLRLAHFQMPCVPWLRATASQLVGIALTEFTTPFPDGFVRDDDSPGEQQLLDIAIAQADAEI